MHRRCRLALQIVLTAGSIVAASAQNTTTLPVSISVSGMANPSGGVSPLTGTGTVTPYGTVSASGNVNVGATSTLSLTFALDSGDSFTATDANGNVLLDSQFSATTIGTATISGGTGKFAGASGSFSYSFQGGGTQATVDTWSLTGSGKLTTPAA